MPLKGNSDPLDILLTKDYLKNYFPLSCFLSFALFNNPRPKSRGSPGADSGHIFQGLFFRQSLRCLNRDEVSFKSPSNGHWQTLCSQMSGCHWNTLKGQTGEKQHRRKEFFFFKKYYRRIVLKIKSEYISWNDKWRHLHTYVNKPTRSKFSRTASFLALCARSWYLLNNYNLDFHTL